MIPSSRIPPLVLCLITERRRLAAACGGPVDAIEPKLLQQLAGAIDAGVDVVQIREPDLESPALLSLAEKALDLTRGTATTVVVNDRLDVAVAAGVHGIHLRENSVGIAAGRRLLPLTAMVGRSVHDAATAAAHRDADYLLAGSVLPTASKPHQARHLGWSGLRELVQAADGCPVWAIGGLTPAVGDALVASGVQGVAAIGAFIPSSAAGSIGRATHGLVTAMRGALLTAERRGMWREETHDE